MALELFKPFIYNKLEERGSSPRSSRPRRWSSSSAWGRARRGHPRAPGAAEPRADAAPSGHPGVRAGAGRGQGDPHPLVCTAFNADFDGDQMAVHIPLAPEAQIEASVLMMSSNNILSPASGAPIAIPSQDIVLGCYYLTKARAGAKGEGRVFGNTDDVLLALEAGEVETLTPIRLRYSGKLLDMTVARDDQAVLQAEEQEVTNKIINTTVGRVLFNTSLPSVMPFVNGLLKKKGLQQVVQFCHLHFGLERTVEMLDSLKHLGFTYATRSGLSIGIDDLIIPQEKQALVERARRGHQGRRAVSRRRDHQRRALQQGHRRVVGRHREDRRRDVRRNGGPRSVRAQLQPGLHHGGLRRARIEAADPPAGRHARPDGQAVGRDHRDADHRQLP